MGSENKEETNSDGDVLCSADELMENEAKDNLSNLNYMQEKREVLVGLQQDCGKRKDGSMIDTSLKVGSDSKASGESVRTFGGCDHVLTLIVEVL